MLIILILSFVIVGSDGPPVKRPLARGADKDTAQCYMILPDPGPQRPRKAGKGRGSSRRRRLLLPWARRPFHLRKMCTSPGRGERY